MQLFAMLLNHLRTVFAAFCRYDFHVCQSSQDHYIAVNTKQMTSDRILLK